MLDKRGFLLSSALKERGYKELQAMEIMCYNAGTEDNQMHACKSR
jgi:hypothetical protein